MTSQFTPEVRSGPRVSVLLPVYNGAQYLESAIISVLDQSYDDFELLVLDDGSTDRSGEIAKHYAGLDGRVKYVELPHVGLVKTLNYGLQTATAPLIARIDADDMALRERFQAQVQFLDENEDVGAVGSFAEVIGPNGRTFGRQEMGPTSREAFYRLKRSGSPVALCHPTVMFRKNLVLGLGGYREEYFPAEDLDLWTRIAEVSVVLALDEVLLKYRIHQTSVLNEQGRAAVESARRIEHNMKRRREGKPELSRDEFRAIERGQCIIVKARRFLLSNSSLYYRNGVGLLAAGDFRGVMHILIALVLRPPLLFRLAKRLSVHRLFWSDSGRAANKKNHSCKP